MRTAPVALILGLAFAGPEVQAQTRAARDFCAERPGKATPPCILEKGRIQGEVGLAGAVFERSRGAHQDTYVVGAAELRFGLTRRLELEAGWPPFVVDLQAGTDRRSGTGDALLGLRGALTDPDDDGIAVSAQGFVTVPTATRGLGAGGWTGGLRLPVSAPLGKSLDLSLTPEVDRLRDADGHGTHLAWTGAAGVSHAFGPTTIGAELWGGVDDDPVGRTYRASADLTAALAVGEDTQLDAGLNLGLTRATPDAEVYIGVARRF